MSIQFIEISGKGQMESVLCEGCGMKAVSKDEKGNLKIAYINDSNT